MFLSRIFDIDETGESPFTHDRNPVTHSENLIEFTAYHDDRLPFLLNKLVHQMVDFTLRTDIYTAGRLVEDKD